MRQTRKVAKSFKIGINGPKIEAKEEDCIVVDGKSIIPLLQAFYIYI